MSSSPPSPTVPRARGLRISLRTKLYSGFLFFAITGLAAGGLLVDRSVRSAAQTEVQERLKYETTMLSQMTANALFGELDPADTSLNSGIRALGEAVHTELAVIAKSGAVVADSDSDSPGSLPYQGEAPEIVAARARGSGTSIRDGRIFVANAIRRDGQLLGFARSSVPKNVIDSRVHGVRRRLGYGALVAVFVAIVLGYAVSSRLLSPMVALFAAARRVGAGDLEHPIAVTTKDEIAELSTAFNGMIGNLRGTIAKLDSRNHDMRLVLDNVNQGLLTVDRGGHVSVERSAVLDTWFGPAAPGTTFWDYVAHVDAPAAGMFHCAWDELLDEVMPFEVALGQLPLKMSSAAREYELGYTPLRDRAGGGAMTGMLVMISDVTARIAAERAESEQREIISVFERFMKDKVSFLEFLTEGDGMVDRLCADVRPTPVALRRLLHTLKGNAAIFGLTRFTSLCHGVEQRIADREVDLSHEDRAGLAGAWSELTRRLHAVVGERADPRLDVDDEDWQGLLRAVVSGSPRSEIAHLVADLKLERVENKLRRFASQATELGARLGKGEIEVDVRTERLRLSREALSSFWASFTHVVRNAVDHGVDYPEERVGSGKPARARLVFEARAEGDGVTIEVSDDGRGIDWENVRRRATELGIPHKTWSDLVDALFHDGFSTKSDVTEVSGRGIGLGAARIECERLGGTVDVASEHGRGTTFRFTFPRERVARVSGVMPARLPDETLRVEGRA